MLSSRPRSVIHVRLACANRSRDVSVTLSSRFGSCFELASEGRKSIAETLVVAGFGPAGMLRAVCMPDQVDEARIRTGVDL